MADKHGDFVWYELATKDADAAKAFYGPLLGWEFEQSGQPGMDYHLITKNGAQIGGIMPLTDEMINNGAHPMWAGYIEVDDVDGSVDKAKGLGASVYVEPTDIPDIGRFAMLADPQGAGIYVMNDFTDETSVSFAKHEAMDGHCAWNELVTTDPVGAKAFYTDMFGWEKSSEMEMGEMGLYEMFSVNGYALGAIMAKPEMMPMSSWVYYLRVPDIAAAAKLIGESGGQLMGDPIQIPDGDYVLQGMDPQGAFFALIGRKGS